MTSTTKLCPHHPAASGSWIRAQSLQSRSRIIGLGGGGLPPASCCLSTRGLAIHKRGGRRQARSSQQHASKQQQQGPLSNEALVAAIVQSRTTGSSADQIQVRVTPDPLLQLQTQQQQSDDEEEKDDDKKDGGEEKTSEQQQQQDTKQQGERAEKPKPVVMSLQEAIQKAVAQKLDLIEIAIQQEIPVVTISSLEAIVYQSEKNTKKKKTTQTASITKEAVFKAGIADADLQRKVDAMVKFLERGHPCQITVKAPRRYLRQNPDAAADMVQRLVQLFVPDHAELVTPPVLNENLTQGKLLLRPPSKK